MLTPPQALEAILFIAGEPLSKKEAMRLLNLSDKHLHETVEALDEQLKGRGIVLMETEDELELRTKPEAGVFAKKLREDELSRDLGKAGLETLAVVAYQGGATRGEIDWVRGVNSSTSVRTLLLRGLIEGKEDEKDRRRTRYVLTPEALAHLGAKRATDLPRHSELSAGAGKIIETEEAQVAA